MTDFVKLSDEPISVDEVNALVGDPGAGAISVFVGTTRDYFQDKSVVSLSYEAYQPMALKEMHKLCHDARAAFPSLKHIAVYHRLGDVPIAHPSVIIAVSSPHRRQAIDACASIIDNLKASVPIWKKEIYTDGSSWKQNPEAFHPPPPNAVP